MASRTAHALTSLREALMIETRARSLLLARFATLGVLPLIILPACRSGPMRPLLGNGGGAGPPATAAVSPEGQRRVLVADDAPVSSATDLLRRLAVAKGAERSGLVERLVELGEPARAPVERAIDESSLREDVLREVLARIEELAPGKAGAIGPRRRSVDGPWVEEKHRLALERYLAQDYLGCERMVDAILFLEPDAALRPKLERLRRRAREELLLETVALARVEPSSSILTPLEPLRATVEVENRCKETLRLKPGPVLGAIGELRVEYEEVATDGTRARRRTAHAVRLANEARVAPGDTLTIAIELPSPHADKPAAVVGRYALSGWLRPHTFLAGDEPLVNFLRLRPREVLVLDARDRDMLAGDPRGKLEESLREARGGKAGEASHRAFVAACLLSREDRDGAIEICARALERAEGELAQALCAALARVTGEPTSYSREEWLAWWRASLPRPGEQNRSAPAPLEDR
jgi:hypothetical protein